MNHTIFRRTILLTMMLCSTVVSANQVVPLGSFNHRPTVKISVNDSTPFDVVIDTGFMGGELMLSPSKVEELGLTKLGESTVHNMGKGQPMVMNEYQGGALSIGEFDIQINTITSIQSKRKRKPEDPQGLLSSWAITSGTLTFDLAQNQLELAQQGELDPEDENTLPLTMSADALPHFPVRIGEQSYSAHIDTGSPSALSMPLAMKEQFSFIQEPVIVGQARIPGSVADIWQGTLEGDVVIGNHILHQPTVNFLAPLQWINIGSAALKNYRVTVDAKNHLISFQKV